MNVRFEVTNLSTSYSKFRICNVSFQLKSGDILGLVGRSGSGKSTVIQALLGLKRYDAGSINAYVDDKQANLKDIIGYSPQENSLFPFLSLEENIMTFARLNKINAYDASKKMATLLKRLDLQKCAKKKINELSGGMQKRADLAVTLIHSPKIIFLDEPFNGLDISLQKFIWEMLRELAQEGCIILVSSHMLTDIRINCNKYGLVDNGRFYNTSEIQQFLISSQETNLEQFLAKLFTKDLLAE